MWTQLAAAIAGKDQCEVWYWGGRRRTQYSKTIEERWVPSFKRAEPSFEPDIVFGRGGFPEYDSVFRRFPKAIRIYYGAGKRFYPRSKFKNYDLILNDTSAQVNATKKKFPKSSVHLFVKPAADNIFRPCLRKKDFDVIFVGNEHPAGIKGHKFLLSHIPKKMKVLQVGISKRFFGRFPNVRFTKWVPRRKIPELYARFKVSVVSCEKTDSCPRVIPESLACGCPLLVTEGTRFWREKYITEKTGIICHRSEFRKALRLMVSRYEDYDPRPYYVENLSIEAAARHIGEIIGSIGMKG